MAKLRCTVVTPEMTLLDCPAKMVVLPLHDGELGIGLNHTPLIGRLGHGEIRIKSDEATDSYFVRGGFVEVLDNVVTVLTSRAMPAAMLDEAVARERLDAALRRPGSTPELAAIRDRAVEHCRAELRVAQRVAQGLRRAYP